MADRKTTKTLRRELTAEEFEELCSLQATMEELCGWWGITPKALNSWCRKNYKVPFDTVRGWCVQDGRIRLRRLQTALAAKSVQMALALSKTMLPPPEAPDEDGPLQEFLRMTAPDTARLSALYGASGGVGPGRFAPAGAVESRLAGIPLSDRVPGAGEESDPDDEEWETY